MMWWKIPGHLEVRDHRLYIGGHDAEALAREYGTPLHVLNGDHAVSNYQRFYSTMADQNPGRQVRVHYAMKTNPYLVELLTDEGAWIDAVSPKEAEFAVGKGYDPQKVLYTGSSVTNRNMTDALDLGVRINIDSPSQMRRLREILDERGVGEYGISIRVDPGKKGAGHVQENITTGMIKIGKYRVPTKFGVDKSELEDVIREGYENGFTLTGLHFHIGSNWRSESQINAFRANLKAVLRVSKSIARRYGRDLEFIDVGGGPGVRYREEHPEFPLEMYASELARELDASGLNLQALAFEPGRYISANTGVLLTEVVDVKHKRGIPVVGVDTGFNNFPRTEIYDAHHEFAICGRADAESEVGIIVVGNICESGDALTRDPVVRMSPMPKEGDILAFFNDGAYTKVMEMPYYNMFGPAKVVLIHKGRVTEQPDLYDFVRR